MLEKVTGIFDHAKLALRNVVGEATGVLRVVYSSSSSFIKRTGYQWRKNGACTALDRKSKID